MPSGYTVDVASGKVSTAQDYILRCARSMSALVHMRDEPLDAPIKKVQSTMYYQHRLEEAQAELQKVLSMTDEELKKRSYQAYIDQREYYERQVEERNRIKQNYESMKQKVEKWVPPTEEHQKLKQFAISQLEDSIQADCSLEYLHEPVQVSIEELHNTLVISAERDLKYYKEQLQTEKSQTGKRTQWIDDLIASLEGLDG